MACTVRLQRPVLLSLDWDSAGTTGGRLWNLRSQWNYGSRMSKQYAYVVDYLWSIELTVSTYVQGTMMGTRRTVPVGSRQDMEIHKEAYDFCPSNLIVQKTRRNLPLLLVRRFLRTKVRTRKPYLRTVPGVVFYTVRRDTCFQAASQLELATCRSYYFVYIRTTLDVSRLIANAGSALKGQTLKLHRRAQFFATAYPQPTTVRISATCRAMVHTYRKRSVRRNNSIRLESQFHGRQPRYQK